MSNDSSTIPDATRRMDSVPDSGEAELLAQRVLHSALWHAGAVQRPPRPVPGLYPLLATAPLTSSESAERSGVASRYAQEWLEQQAVAGFLHASQEESPQARRYHLPAAHVQVLLTATDPLHVAPLADMVAGIAGVLHLLPDAYRSGSGVVYADYGSAFRQGQAAINRPVVEHQLATWLEQLGDLTARLQAPGARIADVGCGLGHSTRAIARALRGAHVAGYDADQASIRDARALVRGTGLENRVSFHVVDAAEGTALTGPVDLVLIFVALHDLARPVEALREARSALAPHGAVMVVDERVSERFTAPGGEIERLMFGWSVTHCLPAALAESPSAGLGTVLRPATVTALAKAAGFAGSRELPLANDFFRVYLLEG